MEKETRLEAFERMLEAVQNHYYDTDRKMRRLKEEGKEKTATYRQLFAARITLKDIDRRLADHGL